MSKRIDLGHNKYALIDDQFIYLNDVSWYYDKQGYASRNIRLQKNKYQRATLHRCIMNTPKNLFTDHINGNTLDNRLSNLRICSRYENARNCKQRQNKKTSKFKGVYQHSSAKKWVAEITFEHKSIYLGLFKTEQLAREAYDQASIEIHKDFSRNNNKLEILNMIEDWSNFEILPRAKIFVPRKEIIYGLDERSKE